MNIEKIVGNALIAFTTAFMAAAWAGGMDSFIVALTNAALFAILATGKELIEENAGGNKKVKRVLNAVVLI